MKPPPLAYVRPDILKKWLDVADEDVKELLKNESTEVCDKCHGSGTLGDPYDLNQFGPPICDKCHGEKWVFDSLLYEKLCIIFAFSFRNGMRYKSRKQITHYFCGG